MTAFTWPAQFLFIVFRDILQVWRRKKLPNGETSPADKSYLPSDNFQANLVFFKRVAHEVFLKYLIVHTRWPKTEWTRRNISTAFQFVITIKYTLNISSDADNVAHDSFSAIFQDGGRIEPVS